MSKHPYLRLNRKVLEKQAENFKNSTKNGNADAYVRIRLHLPCLAEKYDEAMPQERFVLQDV